jgi:hypothetical protein
VRGPILASLIVLGLCGPAAADMVTFRDATRSITLSYDDRLWQKFDPADPRVLIQIERRLLDGKPTAICKLRAGKSAFAAAIEGRLHEEREQIATRITDSSRQPSLEVVSSKSRAVNAGSQPMIEIRHQFKNRSVNWPFGATVIMLYTAREGEEIMLQCDHIGPFEHPPEKEGHFETEMRAVIETLRFSE